VWFVVAMAGNQRSHPLVSNAAFTTLHLVESAAMASKVALQKLIKNSPIIKRGAEVARQEIFGHVQQLNIASGNKNAKKAFTGPYLARYYPESINTYARMVRRVKNLSMEGAKLRCVTTNFCLRLSSPDT
jgi:hypothetical protein